MSTDHPGFTDAVVDKGHSLVASNKVRLIHPSGTNVASYHVYGSRPSPYVVQVHRDPDTHRWTNATCSCPHGTKKGGGVGHCSHIAAVLIVIRHGRLIAVETVDGTPLGEDD